MLKYIESLNLKQTQIKKVAHFENFWLNKFRRHMLVRRLAIGRVTNTLTNY